MPIISECCPESLWLLITVSVDKCICLKVPEGECKCGRWWTRLISSIVASGWCLFCLGFLSSIVQFWTDCYHKAIQKQFSWYVYLNWKLPLPQFLLCLSSGSNFIDGPSEQVVAILFERWRMVLEVILSNCLSEQMQLWIRSVFVTNTFDMIYYWRSSFYRAYFLWIGNREEFDLATCSFGVRSYPCPSKLTLDVIAIQFVCPRDLPFDRSAF